ncbi:Holliday junction resolvase RuvX [Rubrivirga sp.]|uniref:Holliday junction resolvase RuvX n=1 Tax=Rubrivirga sp. TaxID=1885344 RepID=UPI003C79606E
MATTSSRIAGVDYGSRRVGIALADPLRLFARPVGTYAPGDALEVLARMVREEGVSLVVVGLPLLEDGSEGEAVKRVRPFVGRLKKAAGVQVVFQDERDSSTRAMEDLVEAGVPQGRRREKGTLDAAAACVILQDWLDEQGEVG